MRTGRNRRGTSLLETMLSILLLSQALLVLAMMLTTSRHLSERTRNYLFGPDGQSGYYGDSALLAGAPDADGVFFGGTVSSGVVVLSFGDAPYQGLYDVQEDSEIPVTFFVPDSSVGGETPVSYCLSDSISDHAR